jgi:hypothetical protein
MVDPKHLKSIQKTFQSTTQVGHIRGIMGSVVPSKIRAPNLALNVPRRNKEVGTDAVYGSHMIPAVNDGSTCAIVFIKKKSNFRAIHPSGHLYSSIGGNTWKTRYKEE